MKLNNELKLPGMTAKPHETSGDRVIRTRDVEDGIQRELLKEGRAF